MGELYNPYPKLPKNIRQIGDRDQVVKLYVEDYVNTYLKRLLPMGGQDLRVGLLLGNMEIHDGTPYIFIDGAMEMEDIAEQGEKVQFSELAWKKAYQNLEQMFPKRTVQGWFLCGEAGCQLSPLNYWKQHGLYFPGKNKLMYLNSGLEGEESVYITSDDGFYKLQGHSIYYERNQMMQDYMVLRKDAKRVESGNKDMIIRDFRQRMDDRKIVVSTKKNTIGMLGGLCSALSIVVLAGGIVMFSNYNKMKDMESVIASVLPENQQKKTDLKKGGDSDDLLIEEAEGNVYPTKNGNVDSGDPLDGPVVNQGEAAGSQGQAAAGQVQKETAAVQVQVQPETSAQPETQAPPPETSAPKPVSKPAAKPDAQQAAATGSKTYIVGDGETLYGICLKLYQSLDNIDQLCELNGLDDQNKIISGQKLILP